MSLTADWDCDNPRPEDWPVMEVHGAGFKLEPLGLLRAEPRTQSPAAVTFNAVARDSHPMLRLAAPFAIAELAWMLMGFVNTVMAGRLGPAAIGKPKAAEDFARCRDMWRAYPGLNCIPQVEREKFYRAITNEWSLPPARTRPCKSKPEVFHIKPG